MDCSPPGSSVPGISQARILEWDAFSSSWALPNPGIESASPASPASAGGFFTTEPPGKPAFLRATATSSAPRRASVKGTQGPAHPTHPAGGVGTGDTPGRQPLQEAQLGGWCRLAFWSRQITHTLAQNRCLRH